MLRLDRCQTGISDYSVADLPALLDSEGLALSRRELSDAVWAFAGSLVDSGVGRAIERALSASSRRHPATRLGHV